MGKPTLEQCEGLFNHFSHKHPLQLKNHSTLPILSYATCSGCHEEASGSMYTCTICNYYLHKKCSEMPQKITHPCDQEHVLCLLKKPKYPEGIFNCDACGKKGGGFCYSCEDCGTDLHISCAALPIHFSHQCHMHQLTLTFAPAYPKKSFHCGICQCLGSNVWFYRCSSCEFDVHLSCVSAMKKNKVQAANPTMNNQNQLTQQMGQLSMGMPAYNASRTQMMNQAQTQNNMMMNTNMPQSNMMMNATTNPAMYGSVQPMTQQQQQQLAQQMFAQQQQQQQQQQQALAQAMMQKQVMAQNQCNVQQQMTQQQLMAQQQLMVQQQMMAQQQPGNMIMNSLVNGVVNGMASSVAGAATDVFLQGVMGDQSGGVDGSGCGSGEF